MYLIHPVAHTSIGRVLLVVSASGADTTIQTADAQLHRRRTVASRSTQTLNMLLFAPILRNRVERRKKKKKQNKQQNWRCTVDESKIKQTEERENSLSQDLRVT